MSHGHCVWQCLLCTWQYWVCWSLTPDSFCRLAAKFPESRSTFPGTSPKILSNMQGSFVSLPVLHSHWWLSMMSCLHEGLISSTMDSPLRWSASIARLLRRYTKETNASGVHSWNHGVWSMALLVLARAIPCHHKKQFYWYAKGHHERIASICLFCCSPVKPRFPTGLRFQIGHVLHLLWMADDLKHHVGDHLSSVCSSARWSHD